jgi:hypothetical protein
MLLISIKIDHISIFSHNRHKSSLIVNGLKPSPIDPISPSNQATPETDDVALADTNKLQRQCLHSKAYIFYIVENLGTIPTFERSLLNHSQNRWNRVDATDKDYISVERGHLQF